MGSSSPPDWRSSLTGAADPLHAAARSRGDGAAIIAGRDRWSWRELHRAASALASRLSLGGVATDEPVGILAEAGAAYVLALHAVPRAGGVMVPMHPGWTARERDACLSALGIRKVLTADETLELPGGVQRLPITVDGRDAPLTVQVAPPRDPAETHAIVWTSGTSGRPRGVELSLLNLLASAVAVADRLALRPGDRWALSLHPAHVGGLALVIRAAATGGTIVTGGLHDGREIAAAIRAGSVSHVPLVPTQLRRLLDAAGESPPHPSLRTILVGGAAADPDLLARAIRLGYGVAVTYGLTEATSQVCTAPPALVRRKPGSAGPPLGGVTVRIADDGEILVRGPTVMRGYAGGLHERPVRDGWLHTGDLGTLDGEGHLTVHGRKSDRIISGGVNVDPAEVEGVLNGHPGVREAAVVGLPDPEWGEIVAAGVVARAGVDVPAIDAWCRDRLAAAKRPKHIRVVDTLPRTPNGKLDRPALAAQLLQDRGG